ncbi:hypothetical protein HAX54_028729, partial [Datura stramonium]|nr:hypothetical protein [Datura stramonium]
MQGLKVARGWHIATRHDISLCILPGARHLHPGATSHTTRQQQCRNGRRDMTYLQRDAACEAPTCPVPCGVRRGSDLGNAQGSQNGQKLDLLLQLGKGTSSPSQIQKGTSKAQIYYYKYPFIF